VPISEEAGTAEVVTAGVEPTGLYAQA